MNAISFEQITVTLNIPLLEESIYFFPSPIIFTPFFCLNCHLWDNFLFDYWLNYFYRRRSHLNGLYYFRFYRDRLWC